MKYAIYTRCSTEEQANGFSHDYQIRGIKRVDLPGECVGIFSDTISGTTFDRPQLNKLLQYCKINMVQILYVYKWDRFGRNVGDAFQWIQIFRNIGVEVNCPEQPIDYNDPNWPLLQGVNLGIAHSESLKISERTKDGIHQALMQGYYCSKAPAGYMRKESKNTKRRVMVFDPDKAPIVKEIFYQVANGTAISTLIKKYYPILRIKKNAFHNMLRNVVYIGLVPVPPYKGQPRQVVKGKHKALINREIFDLVQSNFSQHQYPIRIQDDIFYVKNHIISSTGARGYWSQGKRKRYPYYDIPGVKGSVRNAHKVHKCVQDVISQITAEDLPEEYLEIAKEEFLNVVDSTAEVYASYQLQSDKIKKRMGKIEQDYMDNYISGSQYSSLQAKLHKELEDIDAEIAQLIGQKEKIEHEAEIFFEHLKDLGKIFYNASNTGRSNILGAIFPGGIEISQNYELRTPYINEVVKLIYCESSIYEKIEIKNGTLKAKNPIEGGRWDNLRTPLILLMDALNKAV